MSYSPSATGYQAKVEAIVHRYAPMQPIPNNGAVAQYNDLLDLARELAAILDKGVASSETGRDMTATELGATAPILRAQEHAISCGNLALELQSALAMLTNACEEAGWPKTAEQMAPMNMARAALKKRLTPSAIAMSASEKALRELLLVHADYDDGEGNKCASVLRGRLACIRDILRGT